MIRIREVELQDNLSLAKMIRAVFEEHDAPTEGTVYTDPTTDALYELFQVGKSVLWVAEKAGQILGCCGIYPTPGLPKGCAELVKFYIPKHSRGIGIGKELMERSIESAMEFDYTEIYIESMPVYSKAVSIYEQQGFEMLLEPLGESGHTGCTIWMLKKLSNV